MYDINGNEISYIYNIHGLPVNDLYDIEGNPDQSIPSNNTEERTGTAYLFSDMAKTDLSNITSLSSSHVRNADASVRCMTSERSTDQTVAFSCNIPTNGERCGIWLYTTRNDTGNLTADNAGYVYGTTVKLTVNSTTKTLTLRAGMNYYPFLYSEVGDFITGIEVVVKSSVKAGGSIFLDSVEVDYQMTRKPIVMFNLDCSPNNFINSAGFNLFRLYGFHATLQYNLASDAIVGSEAAGFNSSTHRQIVEAGHDYASYSGWSYWDTNVSPIPTYDDETKRADFEHHASLLWNINNDAEVYAPSIVHSTGFNYGEVYDQTLCEVGFPLIRVGNERNTNSCFASIDWDEYREIIPYFVWGEFSENSATAMSIKSAILYAIRNNMCLQIGCHIIKPSDYEPTGSNDMNIGVAVMQEVLAYCREKVDLGELIVCNTAEFLARTMPRDKYATWLSLRQNSFVS